MACVKCAEVLERAAGQIRVLQEQAPGLLGTQDWTAIADELVQLGGRIRQQHVALNQTVFGGVEPGE